MNLYADRYEDENEDDEPAYPWDIGVDDTCCCESMNVNCDAADPWCTHNPEYREALRFYTRRSKALESGEVTP
jgi:hypothetical protein